MCLTSPAVMEALRANQKVVHKLLPVRDARSLVLLFPARKLYHMNQISTVTFPNEWMRETLQHIPPILVVDGLLWLS